MRRHALRWGAWVLGVLICAVIVARTPINTDITMFLPGPATPEQAILAEQLRDGVAARVMLVGIEASNAGQVTTAANASRQVAKTLRADPQFAFVANGDPALLASERDRLFDARYLLSEKVSPQRFSVEGLQAGAGEMEALLRSSAAPLIRPFAARDLTGELLVVADQLKPARAPATIDGVWFDGAGRTALLLAATRAAGFDVDAQAHAVATIKAAFDSAGTSALNLQLTGPGVFAVQSRAAIQSDARRLSLIAAVAVGLLLLLVLRSLRFLVWAALPTATGALAGLAMVALAFGAIHGITLGFGLTLIGEAVDYAIYVQVQRSSDDHNRTLWREDKNAVLWREDRNAVLWRGLWLAVLTSSAGFVAMMLSGFAGLVQLGLISIVGIAVAAAVARFCLPDVLRPLDSKRLAGLAPLARTLSHAARLRPVIWIAAVAAFAFLLVRGDRLWNDELQAISPLARGSGEMDLRLRSSLGLSDLRFVIAVEGDTINQALERAEALHDRLRPLQQSKAIAGFDSPAALVPSAAVQQARRAALPDEATLRARTAEALSNSALRADAFEPFIADVQRARATTITPDYYAATALGQRLSAQLVERKGANVALITLTGVSDAAAVSAAVKGAAGASFVDLAGVQSLVADYRVRAAWAALGGALLIVLILAVQLRNVAATARISIAVAVSLAITSALLVLIEGSLTLFHLVALLLAGGIGSNYALFVGMPQQEQQSPAPTVVVSVVLAAATTLIAFAALAMSVTPVLHMIGITVAIGAPVALIVSMAIAAPGAR